MQEVIEIPEHLHLASAKFNNFNYEACFLIQQLKTYAWHQQLIIILTTHTTLCYQGVPFAPCCLACM